MTKFYDTNLSWCFVAELFGVVAWAHWWYDKSMRKRRWMPLEFQCVRRAK